jgi:hypothetical protein
MRIARLESRPIARAVALSMLLAALPLASAAPASANIGETILLRCTHNESISGYSQNDYREALKELSADAEEYSGCSLRIHEAQLAAASGAHGGGGPGAASPTAVAATPAQKRAIARAERASPGPVRLSGGVIHPGVVHAEISSALNDLPTPLLVTLAFLLVCLLAVVGVSLLERVRARGSD